MVGESLTKLKLSVWRDFTPSRGLVLRHPTEEDHRILDSGSSLQQEVYSWHVKEDLFSGISDDEARMRLTELLIAKFDAARPPDQRRIKELGEFIAVAEELLSSGTAEWTVSQDAPSDDEEAPYRLNPLLAVKLHLEWLADSFDGQPGISVSVR